MCQHRGENYFYCCFIKCTVTHRVDEEKMKDLH